MIVAEAKLASSPILDRFADDRVAFKGASGLPTRCSSSRSRNEILFRWRSARGPRKLDGIPCTFVRPAGQRPSNAVIRPAGGRDRRFSGLMDRANCLKGSRRSRPSLERGGCRNTTKVMDRTLGAGDKTRSRDTGPPSRGLRDGGGKEVALRAAPLRARADAATQRGSCEAGGPTLDLLAVKSCCPGIGERSSNSPARLCRVRPNSSMGAVRRPGLGS